MKKFLLIALVGVLAFGTTTSCCKEDVIIWRVIFNSEGGTAIAILDVEDGDHATRPADPRREGYIFLGWYTAASGGTEWDFTTDRVNSDITLHAHWQIDNSVLVEFILEVDGLDADDYTIASWDAFDEALGAAKSVADNAAATPDQITSALTNLEVKFDALVNISLLGNAIAMGDTIADNEAGYTPETWAPFATALAEAKVVYADDDATQDEVEAAITALETAFDNLVEV